MSQKECFFLHAKAHSSGLNLVNATHVFLCEPLINTAIELQYVFSVSMISPLFRILSLEIRLGSFCSRKTVSGSVDPPFLG